MRSRRTSPEQGASRRKGPWMLDKAKRLKENERTSTMFRQKEESSCRGGTGLQGKILRKASSLRKCCLFASAGRDVPSFMKQRPVEKKLDGGGLGSQTN